MDSYLTTVINQDIELNCFSEFAKVASVRPLHQKDEKYKIKDYWPISTLKMRFQKFVKLTYTTVQLLS